MKKTYCTEDVLDLFIAAPVKWQDAVLGVLRMTSEQGITLTEAVSTIEDEEIRSTWMSSITAE